MRQITEFDNEPAEICVLIAGVDAYIQVREDIKQIDENKFQATEYEIKVPYSDDLENRVQEDKETWIKLVKDKVYDETAEQVRAKRKILIEATDNYCLTDRPQPSEEMIEYRQHLRDIPEQEGFPYDIDWGIKPER